MHLVINNTQQLYSSSTADRTHYFITSTIKDTKQATDISNGKLVVLSGQLLSINVQISSSQCNFVQFAYQPISRSIEVYSNDEVSKQTKRHCKTSVPAKNSFNV